MPRSSRANPTDLVIDHEYEARLASIKVGTAAGTTLGHAFGNYLSSGATERLGDGIMKALKAKTDDLKPIKKKRVQKKKAPVHSE